MPNLNPRGRFDRDGGRNRPYYQQQNGNGFMQQLIPSLFGGAMSSLMNQNNGNPQGSYGFANPDDNASNTPPAKKGKTPGDAGDTTLNPPNGQSNPDAEKSFIDATNSQSIADKQAKIKAALSNGVSYDQYNQAKDATEPDTPETKEIYRQNTPFPQPKDTAATTPAASPSQTVNAATRGASENPPPTQGVTVNPSINAPKGDPDDDTRNKSLTRPADQGDPPTKFGPEYKQVPKVINPPPATVAPAQPAPAPNASSAQSNNNAQDNDLTNVEEEFANEPNPRYKDVDYMNMMLAGGLNSPKKTYPKVSKGDNPMQQVSERVLRDLKSEFEKFKNEQLS
jgi:hypothetical protein